MTQQPEIHVGNLSAVRDFLDVRDVARAYSLCALDKAKHGTDGVFNLSSGVGVQINEILTSLLDMATCEIKVHIDPSKVRENEVAVAIGDRSKFCRDYDWAPQVPLRQTLEDTLSFFRENLAE